MFIGVFFISSYDRSSRRHRERSKRSHHRRSPTSGRRNLRHRHREERSHSNSRRRYRERDRAKEREENRITPVKVKHFHFICRFFQLPIVYFFLNKKKQNSKKSPFSRNYSNFL